MVTRHLDDKPFQLKFVRVAQMMLFANVLCDPPFGHATVVPYDHQIVRFTVLIESSRSFPEQSWEAVLWHDSHEEREWHESPLQEISVEGSIRPLALNSERRPSVYRRYFSLELPRPHKTQDVVRFTLKYRVSSSASWRWVNEQSALQDGELYFQSQHPLPDLSNYLKDFSSNLIVQSIEDENPETKLWSISSPVRPAEGKKSGFQNISLGFPRDFTKWFALVRIWSPWLAPRHGKGAFSPTEEAILCSFLRWDGLHLVLLAISGVDDVLTTFKPDGCGNVVMSSRNDGVEEGQARVAIAAGKTFEFANAAVMGYARKLIQGEQFRSGEMKAEMEALLSKGVKAQWMEGWYDGLSYCTWNGLGQNLNEEKIFHALDVLKANGITITNLIIDDNWQSLDNHEKSQFIRGMTDFEANKEGFPQGLRHTVSEIRRKHTHIRHIAVWHALLGYWGGISPTGNIAKKYKTRNVRKADDLVGGTLTMVDADDIGQMYNDFYEFLSGAGIDSVKTDAQFFLDLLDDADDRRRFTKAYQDAWIISSLRYFPLRAISCMSQCPQIIFHSQMPTNKPRLMVRNSDDFFPQIPASHPWHIFTNAHNSLLTSHLNILPDWDMFQTSHPYSSFHAAARCVSGGPIYFTDEPGSHDIGLISQMTALTITGQTVILRPWVIGKSTEVYTAYEEERLLRVGTFSGSIETGTGILGLFNVSQRSLTEFINIRDIPGMKNNEEYIIRGHTTGEISPVMKLDDITPVVSLEVGVKGWEILSAYPLRSFCLGGSQRLKHSTTKVALLGLLEKMTGAAAVLSSQMRMEENGRLRISSSIKALGIVGLFLSDLAKRSVEKTILITIFDKVIPLHTVSSSTSRPVLEINIEQAWKEMGLDGGWSNEIPLEVFIS